MAVPASTNAEGESGGIRTNWKAWAVRFLGRNTMRSRYAATSVAVAIAATTIGPADSQELIDRFGTGGLHLHPFWVQSSVEAGAYYDTNPGKDGGSAGGRLSSNLQAKSDFSRHALNFVLSAEHLEYFDDDIDPKTNFYGGADTRIDIHHDLILTAGIRGGLFQDDWTKVDTALGAAEPVPYSTINAWSTLTKTFNRVAVSGDVNYRAVDYEDVEMIGGGTLDQDFRDGHEIGSGGRLSYSFSPGYSVFFDAHLNARDYSSDDSVGLRTLGGVAFEITSLISGDVGVGYIAQDFDSSEQASTYSYHLGLVWDPTPLVSVRLSGDRIIDDPSIAGSPGSVESNLQAALDYEVLRTLVVSPVVGLRYNDYLDSILESRSLWAGISANYQVTRFLSLGMRYWFEDVDYTSGGADYERQVVGVNAQTNF
jgi:hypothetical protein